MYKRFICFLLIFIISILCLESGFAGSLSNWLSGVEETDDKKDVSKGSMKTVYISEKDISISLPKDYFVYKKNDTEIDELIILNGFSLDMLHSLADASDYYLFAFDPSFDIIINLSINENDLVSMNYLTDQSLNTLTNKYINSLQSKGINVIRYEKKQINGNTYMRFWTVQSQKSYMIQYITIVDSQMIMVSMIKDHEFTSSEERSLEKIVESIVFPQKTISYTKESDLEYYDPEAGVHFAVPEGWERIKIEGRDYLKTKMHPEDNDYTYVMYGSKDIWGMMPSSSWARSGIHSVEDLDKSYSAKDIAAEFGIAESEIETKVYGGVGFCIFPVTQETAYGFSLTGSCAVTIHNGYMILLVFYDLENTYPDMADMVLSSLYFDDTKEQMGEQEDVSVTAPFDMAQNDETVTESALLNYYHDDELGISFLIPEGWEASKLPPVEGEIFKVDLEPESGELKVYIMFGGQDAWGILPDQTKKIMGINTREDMEKIITPRAMAELFDVNESDVEIRTCSGCKFAIIKVLRTYSETEYYEIQAVTIHNGYTIRFKMIDINGEFFALFDDLLNSIVWD